MSNGWPRLDAAQTVTVLSVGLLAGLISLLRAVSFAGLIYPPSVLKYGIAAYCLATVLAQLAYAKVGGLNAAVACASSAALPFLSHFAADKINSGDDLALSATVFVGLALASLFSAVFFMLAGQLRMGLLFRYIQAPVVFGFFVAVGFDMILGGIKLVTRHRPATSSFFVDTLASTILDADGIGQMLTALGLGFVLRFGSRTKFGKRAGFLPGVLALFLGCFALAAFATGTSIEELRSRNWVFTNDRSESNEGFVTHFSRLQFSHVDWTGIFAASPTVVVMQAMLALDLAMSVPAMARSARVSYDIDREFRTAGSATLMAGVGAGPVAYFGLSVSKLSADGSPVSTRATGIVAACVTLAGFFFGGSLLAYTPMSLLGGIVVYLGLGFVLEGVWDCRDQLSKTEFVNVAVIVAVSVLYSMLEALVVGLAYCCALFAWRSAGHTREACVKYVLPLLWVTPMRPRRAAVVSALTRDPRAVMIVGLRGELFFGATPILEDTFGQLLEVKAGEKPSPGTLESAADAALSATSNLAGDTEAGNHTTVELMSGRGSSTQLESAQRRGIEAASGSSRRLRTGSIRRSGRSGSVSMADLQAPGSLPVVLGGIELLEPGVAGDTSGGAPGHSTRSIGAAAGTDEATRWQADSLAASLKRSQTTRVSTAAGDGGTVKVLLLDFSSAVGMDSTGAMFFQSIRKQFVQANVEYIVACANERITKRLNRVGFMPRHVFEDLDEALAFCEDLVTNDGDSRRLSVAERPREAGEIPRAQRVRLALPALASAPDSLLDRVLAAGKSVVVQPGKALYRAGDEADAFYIVIDGVLVERDVSLIQRIDGEMQAAVGSDGVAVVEDGFSGGVELPASTRRIRPGQCAGEMDYAADEPRTSTATAPRNREATTCVAFHRRAMVKLSREAPAVYAAVSQALSQHVAHMARLMRGRHGMI